MASEKEYLVKEELHKGTFDDESVSFETMDRYCMEHGYKCMEREHREIYLNNANRTEKASLETILRYKVIDTEKLQHTAVKEKRK